MRTKKKDNDIRMADTANVTITRKGPSKWQACADWGRDQAGRRVRTYHTIEGPKSEAAALRAAAAWARTAARPTTILSLLNEYVDALEVNGSAAQTIRQYRGLARKAAHTLPSVAPSDLTTEQVSNTLHDLLRCGASDGRPLSRSTVVRLYWFLCGAFDWARDVKGAVSENPVRQADHPQPEKHEATPLSPSDLAAVTDWCTMAMRQGDATERNVAMAATIALHAGLRVGEVCGLRVCDVDQVRRIIAVRGTVIDPKGKPYRQDHTKTPSGMRNVTIDATLADALADHMAWQRGRLDRYGDLSPLVTTDGTWMRPRRVSQMFGTKARELGLTRGVRFHSLRHTFATYQLREGIPMRTVSDRLGHKKIETTLAVYGHTLAGDDARAAEVLDNVYQRAVTDARNVCGRAAGAANAQVDGS